MNISKFFIDRPIFAGVLSSLILIGGLIAMGCLPISEYPEVVPPSVIVTAQFPGANPETIAETVANPIEEQIEGVENMLYMSSQATSDGLMTLTITFKLGTNPDLATELVQNRVNQALPRLPQETQQLGVTTVKSSPDLTMVVHLLSPNDRYDMVYLRNYAVINVKDRLARLPGIGDVRLFGSGDYAMRIWLDPRKVAERGLAASDVVNAIKNQNLDVAAGVIGGSPAVPGVDYQVAVNARGRLTTPEEFGEIVIRTAPDGAVTRLKDVARVELGASEYALRSLLNNKSAVAIPIFQAPGSNALQISDEVRATMAELAKDMPEGVTYQIVYDPTQFVRASIHAVIETLLIAILLVVIVVIVFLQTWRASIIPLLAVPVSVIGTFGIMFLFGFSINALSLFGLVLAIGIVVDDAIVVVENVERNIEAGLSAKEASYKAMTEVSEADHRHRAHALRRVRAARIRQRPQRHVLQAVCVDHRVLHGHFRLQLAHSFARAGGIAVEGPQCAERLVPEDDRLPLWLVLQAVQLGLQARLERPTARASPAWWATRRSWRSRFWFTPGSSPVRSISSTSCRPASCRRRINNTSSASRSCRRAPRLTAPRR